MFQKTRRAAFTLIELLTVMAIITLLIGILTPSLSAARNRATKTAIFAQLNAMSAGLEAFKNDQDEYPPSNAIFMADDPTTPGTDLDDWEVGTGTTPLVDGAHLLKDALVGRDFLGYDPRKTNTATGAVYDRWDPTNDRREPYVKVDGVSVTSRNEPPEDGFGIIPTPTDTIPTIDNLDVNVFRDKFGWPILYYRASPIANQNTPIIQTGNNTNATLFGDGVYDGVDNERFTSYTASRHRIFEADLVLNIFGAPPAPAGVLGEGLGGTPGNGGEFAEFIRSLRATTFDTTNPRDIIWPRPVNSDTFILLSAGKDGNYGTLDDVANFNVLSKER